MNKFEYGIKRFFDYAAAGAGLAVIAIPLLCTAAVMACVNGSSPVFTQTRIGKNGKPFRIYKIKTLKDIFDESGKPLPDALRITPAGCFLRKTRIDELPQFINILKGEMSMVGPRPLPPGETLWDDTLRHSILPGITGLAQIHGANILGYEETRQLDHTYVKNAGLIRDAQIIAATPGRIFKNWNQPSFRERPHLRHQ